jgi:hypothetical protein
LQEVYAKIERLTSKEILSLANEMFDPKVLSSLTYGGKV